MPREGCHLAPRFGVPCDAGRPHRYPALFSRTEGGADACTEMSQASSTRRVTTAMGPGAQRAQDCPECAPQSARGGGVCAPGPSRWLGVALTRHLRCGGAGTAAVSVWPSPRPCAAPGARWGDGPPRTQTEGRHPVPAVAGVEGGHPRWRAGQWVLSHLPRLGQQARPGHAAVPSRGRDTLWGLCWAGDSRGQSAQRVGPRGSHLCGGPRGLQRHLYRGDVDPESAGLDRLACAHLCGPRWGPRNRRPRYSQGGRHPSPPLGAGDQSARHRPRSP
jgi:hypothetical protein